jgi:hypothetical protein
LGIVAILLLALAAIALSRRPYLEMKAGGPKKRCEAG